MKFNVARLDVVAVQTIAPPLFSLPSRAPEMFEALYGALNQEFPLRLSDLTITGGSAYSDIKVSLKSGEGVQVDIGAAGFYAHMRNMRDKESFKRLVTSIEEMLKNFFPRTTFVDSVVRLQGWLACEGEAEAVDALLGQRGQLVFGSNAFAEFGKEFTFRVDMKKPDESQAMSMLLQRAAPTTPGHVFADANFQFNKGHPEKQLAVLFESAIAEALQILSNAGFERESA